MTKPGNVVAGEAAMNCTSGIVVAARKNTNPVPGQPSGNVEKSLCTRGPVLRLAASSKSRNPEKRTRLTPLSRCLPALKVDDSALQAHGDSVCPIVGAEFRKDILDVTFYRLFRDGELGADLLVSISA